MHVTDDLILKQNISILNDGSNTYLHPGTGSLSTIDLSLCDPSLYTDLTWSVSDTYVAVIIFPFLSTALILNLLIVILLGNYTKQIGLALPICALSNLERLAQICPSLILLPFCMTYLLQLYPETSVNLKRITPHGSMTNADLLFLTGGRLSVRLKPPLLQ